MPTGKPKKPLSPEAVAQREANLQKGREKMAAGVAARNAPKPKEAAKPRTIKAAENRPPARSTPPRAPRKAGDGAPRPRSGKQNSGGSGGFWHGLREGLGI